MQNIKENFGTFIVIIMCWVFLSILAAWFFEFWPTSPIGWITVLIVGPLLFVFREILDSITKFVIGIMPILGGYQRKAARRSSEKQVSFYRMSYLFIEIIIGAILIIGLGVLLSKLFGSSLDPIGAFINSNFK